MAVKKKPIDHERIRSVPAEGFSWIDRRFVREGFIEPLAPQAILLYLFLVAVSDARGLSFYADPTISKMLKLDAEELSQVRARLVSGKLILYEYPLYQVLPLPPKVGNLRSTSSAASRVRRGGDPTPLSALLELVITKASGDHQGEDKS